MEITDFSDLKVDVINDIGVLIRIQGRTFENSQIFEPELNIPDMSITTHRISSRMQIHGAKLVGMLIAADLLSVVDSELGRRLQRDKWLTNVMCAVHMGLGSHKELLMQRVSNVAKLNRPSGVVLTDGLS